MDYGSSTPSPAWFLAGLEEATYQELSRFHRLELSAKVAGQPCPDRATDCLLSAYRERQVPIVILGTLQGQALRYAIYDSFSTVRAGRGAISLLRISPATLQRELGEMIRPIVKSGGMLDQRIEPTPISTSATTQEVEANPSPSAPFAFDRGLATGLLLILFLAWPIWLLRKLVDGRELRRRPRPRSARWLATAIAIIAAYVVVSRIPQARGAIERSVVGRNGTALWAAIQPWLPLVGGALWGLFAAIHLPWLFPSIRGLGQVGHNALSALLKAYLKLCVLRAGLLLLYAPVLLFTLIACRWLTISSRIALMIVAPAAGMLVCFWILSLVDHLSVFLDVRHVVGPATPQNGWHATILRYCIGYLRRRRIELDRKLIDQTLFLPGRLQSVVSYGGGLAKGRVLVGERVREDALGEMPETTSAPDRMTNPDELPSGILSPRKSQKSRRAQRRTDDLAELVRRRASATPPRSRGLHPRLIGENTTLLGWVVPQPVEQSVPLISDTREDFDVVKSLLTEHYAAFEKDLDEDVLDDSDRGYQDFLFGALLREVGAFPRGDPLLTTFRLSFALAQPSASAPTRRLLTLLGAFHQRVLSGPAILVADAYVALNQGLHYLIQYLHHLRGGDPTLFTARADGPTLMRRSKEILDRLGDEPPKREMGEGSSVTARHRLIWLSQFFYQPRTLRPGLWSRVGWVGLVVAVVAGWIAWAASDAIAYHPIYLQRMNASAGHAGQAPTLKGALNR